MRQWNRSYRHVKYWEKNSTYRDMIECVLNCTVPCVGKWGGELYNELLYDMYRNWYKQVMKIYHIMEPTV